MSLFICFMFKDKPRINIYIPTNITNKTTRAVKAFEF